MSKSPSSPASQWSSQLRKSFQCVTNISSTLGDDLQETSTRWWCWRRHRNNFVCRNHLQLASPTSRYVEPTHPQVGADRIASQQATGSFRSPRQIHFVRSSWRPAIRKSAFFEVISNFVGYSQSPLVGPGLVASRATRGSDPRALASRGSRDDFCEGFAGPSIFLPTRTQPSDALKQDSVPLIAFTHRIIEVDESTMPQLTREETWTIRTNAIHPTHCRSCKFPPVWVGILQ